LKQLAAFRRGEADEMAAILFTLSLAAGSIGRTGPLRTCFFVLTRACLQEDSAYIYLLFISINLLPLRYLEPFFRWWLCRHPNL